VSSTKPSLDIVGEIRAICANETVLVTADHDTITVDLPRLGVITGKMKGEGARAWRLNAMHKIDGGLKRTNLRLRFLLADRIIARLGADARPGPISRFLGKLFGWAPLEIRPAILVAFLKPRRH
jgi:hypothetical protein